MQIRRRPSRNLVSLDENHEGGPFWAEKLEDPAPDVEIALRRKQTCETLQRVVEELSAPFRMTFRLRVFEGLSISEAAVALGVAQGTVKARFFSRPRPGDHTHAPGDRYSGVAASVLPHFSPGGLIKMHLVASNRSCKPVICRTETASTDGYSNP